MFEYLFTVLSCQIENAKISLLLQIVFTQVLGEVLEEKKCLGLHLKKVGVGFWILFSYYLRYMCMSSVRWQFVYMIE